MYKQDQLVKLTYPDGNNNGFQYKEGVNEDIYELNRNEECGQGGLYFCRFKDIDEWICNYDDALIWKVEIPEGEEVIEYETKLKAKRIILSEPKKAYEDYEISKIAVQENGWALQYVKDQTEELCKLAIEQYSWALQYVREQTPEICKLAVEQNGIALQYVREQTPELCKLAIEQYSWALQYVREQTPEICKLAIEQDGISLQYVREQTPELCKLAIKNNRLALEYVKPELRDYLVRMWKFNGLMPISV